MAPPNFLEVFFDTVFLQIVFEKIVSAEDIAGEVFSAEGTSTHKQGANTPKSSGLSNMSITIAK